MGEHHGAERAPARRDRGAQVAARQGHRHDGSITLVRSLIAAGLVDEYRLFVYPVVLGRGERLFADASGVPKLRLEETRPFRNGTVLLRYRTA